MFARLCLLLAILTGGCHHPAPATRPATQPAAQRPLRIVSYNIHWNLAGVERVSDAIRPLGPDVLFLQEVPEKDVAAFAAALQLPHTFYVPRPLPNEGTWGAVILSKHPLGNTRPIRQGDHWTFGAAAEIVLDNGRLTLFGVHLSPTRRTRLRVTSSPPTPSAAARSRRSSPTGAPAALRPSSSAATSSPDATPRPPPPRCRPAPRRSPASWPMSRSRCRPTPRARHMRRQRV
jgi:hypothetical protein